MNTYRIVCVVFLILSVLIDVLIKHYSKKNPGKKEKLINNTYILLTICAIFMLVSGILIG